MGPDDLADDDFNRELDELAAFAGGSIVQPQPKLQISVKEQLFDANVVTTMVFRAYIEDWEADAVVKRDCLTMYKLLGKYGNMRYIYPEGDTALFYTICVHKMKWINNAGKKKRKDKLDVEDENYLGWACLLIPKGEEFIEEELDSYEVQCITTSEDIHTCIAICDQENVKVVNREGKVLDPVLEFNHYFKKKRKHIQVSGRIYLIRYTSNVTI